MYLSCFLCKQQHYKAQTLTLAPCTHSIHNECMCKLKSSEEARCMVHGQSVALQLSPQNIKSRICTKIIYVPFSRKLYLVTKSGRTLHKYVATIAKMQLTHIHNKRIQTHKVTKRRTTHEEKFICICIVVVAKLQKYRALTTTTKTTKKKGIKMGKMRDSRKNWLGSYQKTDR